MSPAEWPALVLVEGLPGSGKSTTAQWIAHELERQGRAARWIYEEESPHPVLAAARGPWSSWKPWLAARLAAWATFAAAIKTADAVIVVDSTFLQSTVWSTLRHGLDPDVIPTYVERLADLIRHLDPALVYFREDEPDTAGRRLGESRGMAWTLHHIAACDGTAWAQARGLTGLDGLLACWREHARVCDAAAPRSRLRMLTVEPHTREWPARRRLIAEFLGLAWPASAPPIATDLSRFVGHYRGETRREASVSVRDADLVVDGLLWRDNRLLPRAPAVFDAESWPFRVTFEAGPTGEVDRFRLDGPDLARGRLSGMHEKLA